MSDYKITGCVSGGYIYDSIDKGVTWVEESGSPQTNWFILAGSSDGKTIIAAGWYSDPNDVTRTDIYISNDFGATYNKSSLIIKEKEYCSGVASSSDGRILYVGIVFDDYIEANNSSVYRSLDGGVSWVKVYYKDIQYTTIRSITCSADGKTVVVVGEPYFDVSMDGGNTWKPVNVNIEGGWKEVDCSNDGKFIVAISNSEAHIWTFNVLENNEVISNQLLTSELIVWSDVVCSGNGSTILGIPNRIASPNYVTISYNYGKDWKKINLLDYMLFSTKGACSDDGMCLAFLSFYGVGNGMITTTFNGGKNWTVQNKSYPKNWSDIMVTSTPVCVLGKTNILMADGSLKQIKDIVRGERVVTDKMTGATKKVARVLSSVFKGAAVRIPKGTLGGTEEVICTEDHPVWSEDGTYRTKSKDVKGAIRFQLWDTVYNLQYEEEGTYYAEGIRMDSVSPYFYQNRLPKELYFNKAKHDKRALVKEENDPKRGKPKMI